MLLLPFGLSTVQMSFLLMHLLPLNPVQQSIWFCFDR